MTDTDNATSTASTPPAGRGTGGKFTAGNKFGRGGSPRAVSYARLADAMVGTFTDEDMERLARKLYDQAMGGCTQSAKLVMEYCLPKPAMDLNVEQRRSPLEDLSDEQLAAMDKARQLEAGDRA